MATTAAPAQKIGGFVYLDYLTGGYLGPRVGKATIDITNGNQLDLSARKLDPGQLYAFGVTPGPEPSQAPTGVVAFTADSEGRISISDYGLSNAQVNTITSGLSAGGALVLFGI